MALTLYGQTPTSSSSSCINNYPTVRHSFATRLHQQSTESMQSPPPEFRPKRAMTTGGEKKDSIQESEHVDVSKKLPGYLLLLFIICHPFIVLSLSTLMRQVFLLLHFSFRLFVQKNLR